VHPQPAAADHAYFTRARTGIKPDTASGSTPELARASADFSHLSASFDQWGYHNGGS
jgi:hypothetical protein